MRSPACIIQDIEENLKNMNPVEAALFGQQILEKFKAVLGEHGKNVIRNKANSLVDDLLAKL